MNWAHFISKQLFAKEFSAIWKSLTIFRTALPYYVKEWIFFSEKTLCCTKRFCFLANSWNIRKRILHFFVYDKNGLKRITTEEVMNQLN